MAKYEDAKITQCLNALEKIELHGSQNMLMLLFIKQTLQNPEKEENDGSNKA